MSNFEFRISISRLRLGGVVAVAGYDPVLDLLALLIRNLQRVALAIHHFHLQLVETSIA